MKHSEVAVYIINDTFDFTKKTVKKASKFSFKWVAIGTLLTIPLLGADYFLHFTTYKNNSIEPIDLVSNHHSFNPTFLMSDNLSLDSNHNWEEKTKEHNNHIENYTPFTSEFSLPSESKKISYIEQKNINSILAQHYQSVCDTGMISKLLCTKYSIYDQIKKNK